MFDWFRRIRRINIFGFELEFNHPPENPSAPQGERPGPSTKSPEATASPPRQPKTVPLGAKFTAYGQVIKAYGSDLGVRVRNEADIRDFWRVNQLDTKLDWFGRGTPVVSITHESMERCKVGDEVAITLETVNRAGGKRGAKPVAFEVRSRA